MTARTERALWLGEQLRDHMIALGAATRAVDVLLFLDRLARLEALPADELAEAGLVELVASAVAARDAHRQELGRAAGEGLDLDRFLELGRDLPPDPDDPARDGWLRDLLLVAVVLPWLSPDRRDLARTALEQAVALVEADPEAFLAASSVATDRWEHEQPQAWNAEAREALQALGDLPLLVLYDRAAGETDQDRVAAALERAGEDAREAAEDALLDWEIRRNLTRRPTRAAGLVLHAAVQGGAALCRMLAGLWEILPHPDGQALRWHPQDPSAAQRVSAEILGPDGPILLSVDNNGDFILPPGDGPSTLRLSVGPDSRTILLNPEGR